MDKFLETYSLSKLNQETQTYGSTEQNRDPKISPHTYIQLIYDKEGKNIHDFGMWCWESWTAAYKSVKLEYSPTPYPQIL